MKKKIMPGQFNYQDEDSQHSSVTLESCLLDLRRAEETIVHQQRQLYQLEARYNALFNSLDEGFCIIEVLFDSESRPCDYRFLKVNSVFEVQTGIKSPLGRTMREIVPGHERHWYDIYGQIALTGEAQRFEHRADALGKFYDVFAFRIGDPRDAQVAVLFKDIAERKKREELQAYLLQFSDVLRPLSDPGSIQEAVAQLVLNHLGTDRSYFCEMANGQAVIRSEALRGGLSPISAGYGSDIFPVFRVVFNGEQPFVIHDAHSEAVLDDASRQLCVQLQVISFLGVPVMREGIPVGILFVTCCEPRKWRAWEVELLQETAERAWMAIKQAKAREALRESEENYRVIVNQSIAGILKVDLRGGIIFSNEQFCSTLGYELPELLTLGVNDIVYPDDHERNRTTFAELASAGKAYEIEKRLVRKDGEIVWVNNHVSPIFDKKGTVIAATVVSIDISRQKALERQKDEFISIASHELKTPLTSIKVYGEILAGLMDKSVTPPIGQLVTKMNMQVNRLVKLIYSLLNTSRISGGQLALQLEAIDLNVLLEEHVHQGQLTTSKHQIIFTRACLPIVSVDVERLGQVLDNLISNAIKYAPGGGDIIVRAESHSDFVRVSVQDFGVGVPKGMQEKIFDRFYRVKGAVAEAVSGIGLGLYICREIIGKHQGKMGVESVLDEGSTFYFDLPVHRESQ